MIRFRLAELMTDKGFREGRRVEIGEVADASGVHRSTLSRIINVRGTNVTTANLNSLCRYFGCALGDLAEYVPDEELKPATTESGNLRPATAPASDASRRAQRPRSTSR